MKACDTRYFDPLTGSGRALPTNTPGFLVHETGKMLLDRHWSHASVRSPFWRAYFNLKPGAGIFAGNQQVPLGPDRVVILPPLLVFDCQPNVTIPHVTIPHETIPHVWIHFSAHAPLLHGTCRTLTLSENERELWHRLGDRIDAEDPPELLMNHALACLHLLWCHLPARESLSPSTRMQKWLSFVQNRLSSPPALDEMAHEMAMGRRSFLRWFKQETHRTPQDYFMDLRIREACLSLRYSEASIETIAESTGFADRHHFSRVFKQRAGISPAVWRATFPPPTPQASTG